MEPKILDLESMVERWAKNYFSRRASRKERKWLEKDCVRVSLDWKRITFEREPTDYNPDPPAVGSGSPNSLVLFNAYFTNKTSSKQKYTFSVERSTRSTCKLDIEKGYTLGTEGNFKLATPCKIAQASVGFKEELSLTSSEGYAVEQELSWGTNSEIEVDPKSKAEAKLIIDEEEYKGSFKTVTKISGRMKVNFTNCSDNNNFIKAVEVNIADLAKRAEEEGIVELEKCGAVVEGQVLKCTTLGKCHFRYGIKQTVEVGQVPYLG